MKKVKFSDHSQLKIELLKKHGMVIDKEFIKNAVLKPDRVEKGYKERLVAQKKLDRDHVLRIVYEEHNDCFLIITVYPGRRDRYEKD